MILSTNTSHLARIFGHKKAIEMLADAGFDAYDMSFFEHCVSELCAEAVADVV